VGLLLANFISIHFVGIVFSSWTSQTPSKRRTDGQTNTCGNNVHRSPPSRRVDVAATRDKQTDGRTDAANYIRGVCPSLRWRL